MQPVPPAAPAAPAEAAQAAAAQPNFVIVSQRTENTVIASSDQPMVLVKAARTEQAVLRYVLFVVDTTSLVRPDVDPPGRDMLQWTSYAYLQRQMCFTSITGLFTCSEAEILPLKEKSEGRVPAPPADGAAAADLAKSGASTPFVEVSRSTLYDGLRERAAAIFEADRREKVDPMLKAAGATVRPPSATPAPNKRR